ncbi:MAG TPA: hypothetical protein VGO50_17835 [Pyrinomonadaceae bacterium]|jgi:hypothetical protein|nr:hypothetical protein [Pyrinomonadaceae bacterium]
MGGFALVLVGCFFGVAAIVARAIVFRKDGRKIQFEKASSKWWYYLCATLAMFGTGLAALGFFLLISDTPYVQTAGKAAPAYSSAIGILSILAAGVTAGFFSFTYNNVGGKEVVLPTLISVCFVIMFYLVFGAISFYMGRDKGIHDIEFITPLGTIIMWLLLAANVGYDFLDYRDHNP